MASILAIETSCDDTCAAVFSPTAPVLVSSDAVYPSTAAFARACLDA
jgi:tRNA A37 threonylcarbamoyltransferase TsaD